MKGELTMKNILIVLLIILCILLGCALSFLITAGLVKLIFILLGLKFSWKIAGAIWLALIMIAGVVRSGKN